MGHRITWRSRPRSEYPWLYRTEDKPLVELGIGAENPYDMLIGPLPMNAVAELLHRVIQFDYTVSITGDPGGGGGDVTQTGFGTIRMVRNFYTDPTEPDEIDIFTDHRTRVEDDGIGAAGTTSSSIAYYDPVGTDGLGFLEAVTMGWSGDWETAPIFRDDSDPKMFWLQGEFFCQTTPADPVVFSAGNFPLVTGGWLLFDASLVLACGTFPIKCAAEATGAVSAASLVLTASEWFPYADKAGADAWNTATGAPANGGPAG